MSPSAPGRPPGDRAGDPLKIRSVEFAIAVASPGGPVPTDLPQVAFSGRSNVGKSSLINTLLRRTRKKLAHVSGRPGKTQTVNFYRVNEAFYLVDLPGFGFARVPDEVRAHWKVLIEDYLESDPGPLGLVHLIDIRRGAQPSDLEMLAYLAELGKPTLVVLTKADKLKRSRRISTTEAVLRETGLDRDQVILFSSLTGEGRDELSGALSDLLASSEESS